ncbi:MAG: triose-phosphate isomerase [Planctomycetota bacterium]
MRRPFFGGNWKMNTTRAEAAELGRAVARDAFSGVDVAVFPPFVWLNAVGDALAGSPVALGAQDCSQHQNGAHTGEVSASMLAELGVAAVLVGHSERRHDVGEPDDLVRAKLAAVLDAGLTGVLCIGETLEQREAGQTDAVNERQLRSALDGLPGAAADRLVIAYEPVWAIGTGRTASPADAQAAHAAARGVIAGVLGGGAADAMRIIYGGSMKAANAAALLAEPDVDGGLVGGASLAAADFAEITRSAATANA